MSEANAAPGTPPAPAAAPAGAPGAQAAPAAPGAAGAAAGAVAAKSGKSKLILMLVGGMVLGGAGIGGYWFVTKGAKTEHTEKTEQEKEKEKKDEEPKARRKVVKLQPVIVNLKQSQGRRYLKVTLGLETSSDVVAKELESLDTQLRDLMVQKFSSVELTDVDNVAGHNKLKREIQLEVNELLESGSVTKVYFSEFVIQ